MAIPQQLINKFDSFKNYDLIYRDKYSEREYFMLATVVSSDKPGDVTPSSFPSAKQELKSRFEKYIKQNFVNSRSEEHTSELQSH